MSVHEKGEQMEEWLCRMTSLIKNKRIGDGTYGLVYTARFVDRPDQQVVVKRNLVEDTTDFFGSLRELDLLIRLQGHPNVVQLLDVGYGSAFSAGPMSPLRSGKEKEELDMRDDHIHFIFEQGMCDLHTWLYRTNKPLLANLHYVRSAMAQLLIGLEFIHGHGVIHRDIKPANILVFKSDAGFVFKFCDFGMGKPYTRQGSQSPKVCTSWYRAPDICLENPDYGYAADVWSLGCVFAELFSRSAVLYDTGDKSAVVLRKILRTFPFCEEDCEYAERELVPKSGLSGTFHRSWLKKSSPEVWTRLLKQTGQVGKCEAVLGPFDRLLELICGMLRLDPNKRLTAGQALSLPFFADYADEIRACREAYPPDLILSPQINAIDCAERKWAMAQLALVDRKQIDARIIFQTIDLFDRCLVWRAQSVPTDEAVAAIARQIETAEKGQFWTKTDSLLWLFCCLYICLKFFSTACAPPAFRPMLKSLKVEPALVKKFYGKAMDVEKTIVVDVCRGWMYRPTMYEAADRFGARLTEQDVDRMLTLCTSEQLPSFSGYSPSELFEFYRKACA